jgi:integrative and conjugative element protein (TIGR02256 family)
MLKLILPSNIASQIERALVKAGRREIGGLLMAEHVGTSEFVVRDLTINRGGTFASFVRQVKDVWPKLNHFFDSTKRDYARFNYIGEWHSHPSFEPIPSAADHQSMSDIIADKTVGGHFVVLVVLKLDPNQTLIGSVHTYLPSGVVERSQLMIQREQCADSNHS